MARSHKMLTLLFGLLALLKAWVIVHESGSAAIVAALMYMALFGSPQIFWAVQSWKPMEPLQAVIAYVVVVLFVASSWYFGFVPGSSRPSWGGEPHWEVPAAFIVEWAAAVVVFVPFWFARRRGASNDA